jgi:hypothetical protein
MLEMVRFYNNARFGNTLQQAHERNYSPYRTVPCDLKYLFAVRGHAFIFQPQGVTAHQSPSSSGASKQYPRFDIHKAVRMDACSPSPLHHSDGRHYPEYRLRPHIFQSSSPKRTQLARHNILGARNSGARYTTNPAPAAPLSSVLHRTVNVEIGTGVAPRTA